MAPKNWAVLIGIDFYREPKFRLRGAVNDVTDLALDLKEHCGEVETTVFIARSSGDANQVQPEEPPEDWPTYENIFQRLEYIHEHATAGDRVYIHYSGHGALRPKTEEDEYNHHNGKDAALVLFDAATTTGTRYLRGLDLARLLDLMLEKELQVTITLDSCHSGSVSRGSTTRGIPWDHTTSSESPMQPFQQEDREDLEHMKFRDGDTDHHWLLNPSGYILLAACGPHEKAEELHDEESDKYYGAFSYHYMESLYHLRTNYTKRITGQSIIRRIRAKFNVIGGLDNQNPLMIGTAATDFFGSNDLPNKSKASCEIIGILDEGRIKLNIGHAHGVSENDSYTIDRTSVELLIVSVHGFYCVAQKTQNLRSQTHSQDLEVGMSATLAKLHKPKAEVFLFQDAGPEWTEVINKSSWLTISNSWKHKKAVPRFRVAINDSKEYEILEADTGQSMRTPRLSCSETDPAVKMTSLLEHLAKYILFMKLENGMIDTLPETSYDIELKVDEIDESSKPISERNCIKIRDEGVISVTFHNHTPKILYFLVMNFRPRREIAKISKDVEYKHVGPNDKTCFRLKMSIPKQLRNMGESRVTDTFKFIIATAPLRVEGLTLPDPWDGNQKWRGFNVYKRGQRL